ncbi:hypothetical protein [Streptomyces sp. NBC_01618]|uniref:hypothetical protein n=1 Tax=Streptomyces sp. NBC_01618 TaxID=2975900 RepID=UPI00387013E0|nr:hypothetical protein OH735_16645 [Streptomyces sp. NBC_01618]
MQSPPALGALDSTPDVRIVTYLTDAGTASADALDLLRGWVATTHTSTERARRRGDVLDAGGQ